MISHGSHQREWANNNAHACASEYGLIACLYIGTTPLIRSIGCQEITILLCCFFEGHSFVQIFVNLIR